MVALFILDWSPRTHVGFFFRFSGLHQHPENMPVGGLTKKPQHCHAHMICHWDLPFSPILMSDVKNHLPISTCICMIVDYCCWTRPLNQSASDIISDCSFPTGVWDITQRIPQNCNVYVTDKRLLFLLLFFTLTWLTDMKKQVILIKCLVSL